MTSARGFAPIGWFDGNKTAQLVSYPFEGVSPPPSAAPPSNAGATSFSEFGMWIRFAAPYRTGSVLSIVVGRGRFLVSCSFSLSKSQSYNLFICLVSGRRLPRARPRSFANLIGLPLRGVRQRGLPLQLVVRRPGVPPPPPAVPPSNAGATSFSASSTWIRFAAPFATITCGLSPSSTTRPSSAKSSGTSACGTTPRPFGPLPDSTSVYSNPGWRTQCPITRTS
jgi:hypothetical protein